MKNIKYILGVFLSLILISGCEKENYEFGDLITPSNLKLTAEIVGKNATNPFGDGSGKVNFTATSNDVITYKYVHKGAESMAPGGTITYNFGITGIPREEECFNGEKSRN